MLSSTEVAVGLAEARSRTAAEVGDPSVTQMADPDSTRAVFGANEWLVDELFEQYQKDKNAVDPAWWDFFEGYKPEEASTNGSTPATTPRRGTAGGAGRERRPDGRAAAPARRARGPGRLAAPARSAGRSRRARRPPRPRPFVEPPAGDVADRDRPAGDRPVRPGRPARTSAADEAEAADDVQKLRGPAARVVTNMEASLEVPTATSVRAIAGQADGRQPHRHQQPPRPWPRRQDLVHAPHRLRDGRGAGRDAGDEHLVHAWPTTSRAS